MNNVEYSPKSKKMCSTTTEEEGFDSKTLEKIQEDIITQTNITKSECISYFESRFKEQLNETVKRLKGVQEKCLSSANES